MNTAAAPDAARRRQAAERQRRRRDRQRAGQTVVDVTIDLDMVIALEARGLLSAMREQSKEHLRAAVRRAVLAVDGADVTRDNPDQPDVVQRKKETKLCTK